MTSSAQHATKQVCYVCWGLVTTWKETVVLNGFVLWYTSIHMPINQPFHIWEMKLLSNLLMCKTNHQSRLTLLLLGYFLLVWTNCLPFVVQIQLGYFSNQPFIACVEDIISNNQGTLPNSLWESCQLQFVWLLRNAFNSGSSAGNTNVINLQSRRYTLKESFSESRHICICIKKFKIKIW